MTYLPLLNEGELNELVSYSLDENEEMVEAVANAFHAANIDVVEKPTLHGDGFNGDVLEEIQWSSDRPLYLCTKIWDHQVVITPEEVRIYSATSLV